MSSADQAAQAPATRTSAETANAELRADIRRLGDLLGRPSYARRARTSSTSSNKYAP